MRETVAGLLVAAYPGQVFDGRVVRGDDGLERDGAAHHERMRRLVKPDAGHADAFWLDSHDAAGAVVPRCRRYDGNARRKRRDLAVLTDGRGGLVAGRPADGRFCALGLQRRGQLFGLFSGVKRQCVPVERDTGQAGLTGLFAGDGDGDGRSAFANTRRDHRFSLSNSDDLAVGEHAENRGVGAFPRNVLNIAVSVHICFQHCRTADGEGLRRIGN